MHAMVRILFAASVVVTAAAFITWRATGGDFYTKFEVIEFEEAAVSTDDPLAGTGFYDDGKKTQTVVRPAFKLGLLPAPQGIFDKHILSVATVTVPFWAALLALGLISRARARSRERRRIERITPVSP
jgi:hypothetical protein